MDPVSLLPLPGSSLCRAHPGLFRLAVQVLCALIEQHSPVFTLRPGPSDLHAEPTTERLLRWLAQGAPVPRSRGLSRRCHERQVDVAVHLALTVLPTSPSVWHRLVFCPESVGEGFLLTMPESQLEALGRELGVAWYEVRNLVFCGRFLWLLSVVEHGWTRPGR